MKKLKAQTFLEYILLLGIVAAIITAMSTMIRRGAQSFVRAAADQLGNQQYSESRANATHTISALTRMETSRKIHKKQTPVGYRENYLRDETRTGINQVVNMGVTEK